ncbi:speckle-type POZ protein B-like [Stegodyphus dumicola]|uniref:speckle-type POZ protein B-like n=1 Tax=Stegodyphus dumicola TaxID=202533 RepID=UPI0015ABF2EF|nr:speckle-type POZ protein B-like [Stegodyphus dumicola]
MEKQAEYNFAFTWIIKKFSMYHHSCKQFICSPEFALYCLPRMKLRIELYPRGDSNESYVAVYLKRTDDIPETCNISFTVEGVDCKDTFFCRHKGRKIFKPQTGSGYSSCIKRNTVQSFINDTLILKFTLKPVCEASKEQILTPHTDLELPYKPGLFADVVLRASSEEFKVNKAVLWARWPKLVEKMDAEETCEKDFDMRSDVLEAIIGYVYTGKIDNTKSDLFADLYAASEKYELLSLQCLPVVAQTVRTHINVKSVSFEWPIQNFSGLPLNTVLHSHVFSVDILKSCKWNLRLHMLNTVFDSRVFDISLCKVYDPETRPIFVRSKISVHGTNFSENEHLFETDKYWKCGDFSHPASLGPWPYKELFLKVELKFSDCNSFSEIIKSSNAYVSSVICHSFISDFKSLYKSGMLSDISIIVGDKTFPEHKCVLCARSSVFARMLQTGMIESERNSVEISDVDPQIMDEFLLFMYTGNMEKSLDETAEELYAVADKYDVPVLQKKCSSFLKSNLSVGNVCRIVQLASFHSDDDLYKSVLEFSCAHAEEIFSTDEWKAVKNANCYVKLLQDMLIQKKCTK